MTDGPSDGELLGRYAAGASEEAFRELVRRHARMVYSVCRRALGDAHLAEDASQATFVILARKARRLKEKAVLSDWLHRTAQYVAADLRRRLTRSARREKTAAEAGRDRAAASAGLPAGADLAALRPLIDEAMVSLPASARQALVLHYLEGRSREETARLLGCSADALRMRLNYGVERLREKLSRKGVVVSVALLAGWLAGSSAEAAPPALVEGITSAALAAKSAPTIAGVVADGALRSMLWGKLKLAGAGLLLVAGLAVSATGAWLALGPQAPVASTANSKEEVHGVPPASAALAAAAATTQASKAPAGQDSPKPLLPAGAAVSAAPADDVANEVTQGALRFKDAAGTYVECPLKHTDVSAAISGFIARVKVSQTFVNASKDRIEAVYVFPLPHESAVDGMTMVVGDRRVVGLIKRRAAARQIYERAVAAGQTAALLEQERPNIFTQSVGNIQPGQTVRIEITYVDVLKYDMGVYNFHFPMTIGHRYNPAGWSDPIVTGGQTGPTSQTGPTGPTGPSPVVIPYTQRPGHDISLSVSLDAGVPIQDFKSVNHQVDLKQTGKSTATCAILPADSIPNKDFDLRYKVVGDKPEVAVLAHADSGCDGYFMLMVQPKEDETAKKAPPREMVFLVDASGSMEGQPTAKTKQALKEFLGRTVPGDKLQVITFNTSEAKCFDRPVEATAENVKRAGDFVAAYAANGGTEMLKGVREALSEPADGARVRIVIMLTDGGVSNEAEIVEEVGKRCGDRVRFWCLGIGSSPNMHLVDGVAKQGGGMGKVLSVNSAEKDVQELVGEVVERIHRAQLANIAINWGSLNVYETYPARVPELWAGRPVVVFGRYTGGGRTKVRIGGEAEGQAVSFDVAAEFPEKEAKNDVLAAVWARKKIESLMDSVTHMDNSPEVVEEVTKVALEYKLMSKYTSFVAVDESTPPEKPKAPPVRVAVPVCVPQGVNPAVFGLGEGGYEGEVVNGRLVVRDAHRAAAVSAVRSALEGIDPSQRIERQERLSSIEEPVEAADRLAATRGTDAERTKGLGEALKQYDRAAEILKWMDSRVPTAKVQERILEGRKRAEAALADIEREKRTQQLLDEMEKVARTPADPKAASRAEAVFAAGKRLYDDVRYEEALDKFNEALRVYPRHQAAGEYAARTRTILNMGIDPMRRALEALEVRDRVRAQESLTEVQNLVNAGNYDRALEIIKWLPQNVGTTEMEKGVQEAKLRAEFAQAQEQRSRAQAASASGRDAEKMRFQQTIGAMLARAQYDIRIGKYEEAEGVCGQVLKLDPGNGEAASLRTSSRNAHHKANESRTYLDRRIELASTMQSIEDADDSRSRKHPSVETVQKIFDVRDLTQELTNFPGPRLGLGADSGSGTTTQAGAKPPVVTGEALAEVIKRTVSPGSWGAGTGAGIVETNGQLVVHGSPELQAQVAQLLTDFRKSQTLQVHAEARYLDVRQGFAEEIGVDWETDSKWNADPRPSVRSAFRPRYMGYYSTLDGYTIDRSEWYANPPVEKRLWNNGVDDDKDDPEDGLQNLSDDKGSPMFRKKLDYQKIWREWDAAAGSPNNYRDSFHGPYFRSSFPPLSPEALRAVAERVQIGEGTLGKLVNANQVNNDIDTGKWIMDAGDLQESLEKKQKALAEAQTKLTQAKATSSEDAAHLQAAVSGLQNDCQKIGESLRNAEYKLSAAMKKSPDLVRTGTVPDVRTKVVDLRLCIGLVAFGQGRNAGIKEGMVFLIHRGEGYIGKVRVTQVEDDLCAGQIIESKSPFKPGDDATLCPATAPVDTNPAARGRLVLDSTVCALHAEALKAPDVALAQAKSFLASGRELAGRGALSEARPVLQLALLHDTALARLGVGKGEVAKLAFDELKALESRYADARLVIEPRLSAPLALVLRDVSLEDALSAVAKAAGVKLSVSDDSLEDAARFAGRKELRVEYRDLSGQTASAALDGLCTGAGLQWSVERGRVTVTSVRRGELAAPWTYDVAVLAVPSLGELVEGKGDVDLVAACGAEASAFLAALREAAGVAEPGKCFWLAPGQIVLFGSEKNHLRAEKFLAGLAKGGRSEIAAKCARRFAERKDAVEAAGKSRAAAEARRMDAVISEGCWPLLTEARAGRCDLRALTLLAIAWKHPAVRERLANAPAPGDFRSAWMISESALALSGDKEIRELARAALSAADRPADSVLDALAKKPADEGLQLSAVYAALALSDGRALGAVKEKRFTAYRDRLLALLAAPPAAKKEGEATPAASPSAPTALVVLARALLDPKGAGAGGEVERISMTALPGEDLNLLAATAARRAGERTWLAFRAAAPENFRGQNLPGRVALLVSRMEKM